MNFPVRPFRTSLTNYSGKTTYQVTQNNKLVAFGQTGRNHQPNRLDPFGPTGLRQSDDGDQRIGGGDHGAARLGLGVEGRVELGRQ